MPSRSWFIASRCLTACLPLLAACGGEPAKDRPEPPAVGDFEDGSRLSGLFVATTAGEPQQIGILDRGLGVSCEFLTAENDRLRCLPSRQLEHTFWPAYSDAACTRDVSYTLGWKPDDPRLVTVTKATSRALEVRRVETLSAPLTVFAKTGEGNCVLGAKLQVGTAVLGERVDPAIFVAARAAGPRRTDGSVTTWQIEGEDGSRFQTGLYDLAAGRDCTAIRLDEAICLGGPRAWGAPGTFADAGCTRRVVMGPGFSGGGPAPTTFIDGQVARAVGARWDGPLWQLSDAGDCEASERIEEASYYEAGEVLHPPRLVFRLEGQGRVKREVLRDDQGELLGGVSVLVEGGGVGLVDSTNGGSCEPLFLPDGSFRCVTLGLGRIRPGEFADPGCRVPTVNLGGGGGPPGVIALLGEEAGAWGKVTAVHALGEGRPMYYEGLPAACQGPWPTKANATPLGEALPLPDFEPLVTNHTR